MPFVYGADSYGNDIYKIEVNQNGVEIEEITSDPTTTNYTITNYLANNYDFEIITLMNTTEYGGGFIYNYQGVGIQLFEDDDTVIYQNALTPFPLGLLYDPLPLEYISWDSPIIELELFRTAIQANVTMWIYNGTSWNLEESWKFNLVADNYGETDPVTKDYWDYFLGIFVLCLFAFPLSIVGLIKLKNPIMVKVAIFALIGLICTFFIIMGVTPFGS